jgi:hypothetical protein
MATRRERVILELEDHFTSEMMRPVAAAKLLKSSLKDLDGTTVKAGSSTRGLAKETDELGKTTGKTAKQTKAYTLEMALAEEKSTRLRKALRDQARAQLDAADGANLSASAVRTLGSDSERGGRAIDRLSGRLALLAHAASVLGPALLPVGAVAAPAIAGLASALGIAAIAGGSALVAFSAVGEAVKAIQEADLHPTVANLEKAQEAMERLGPDAREFVRSFQEFRPVLTDIRDAAAAGWFPGLIETLESFEDLAPRIISLFEDVGRAGGDAVAAGAESLAGERYEEFFTFLNNEAPQVITRLASIVGSLTHAATEMWMAFDPGSDAFLTWLDGVASGFDRWASSAEGRADVAAFLDYVQQTGPQVAEAFGSLVNALVQISQAAAPLGGPVLEAVSAFADVLAAIADSNLGTPIFTTIAAMSILNRAVSTWGAISTTASARFATGMITTQNAAGKTTLSMTKLSKAAGALPGLGIFALGLSNTNEALGTLEATAGGAAAGLAVGGPWGAAVGGAIGLVVSLGTASDETAGQVDAFTAALDKQTGALTEVNRELAIKTLTDSGALDAAQNLGLNLATVTDAALGNAAAIAAVNEALDGYSTRIAGTNTGRGGGTTGYDQEAAAVVAVKTAISDTNDVVDLSSEKWRQNAEAQGDATDATGGLTGARAGLASATLSSAQAARLEAKSINDSVRAMRDKRQAALAAFDAETQWREALKSAREQADKTSAGIKGNSDAALENRRQLGGLAAAWNNQSVAVKNNNARFQEARSAFIETATAMGVPKKAARELAAQILDIPKSKVVDIKAKTEAAKQALAEMQARMDALRDKTVTIRIRQLGEQGIGPLRNDPLGYAAGGLVRGLGDGHDYPNHLEEN